ncbi:MAG: glycosyltransferase family 1 protein [Zetaproteobacteria bacterium]|nr:MAG: glycosyltransferase family 1 protein [Zetaproteobacteria bacterium]
MEGPFAIRTLNKAQSTSYHLQIRPRIPEALSRMEEIADDMWFSWNHKARALFHQIDHVLWNLTGHNPRLFLRRVSQRRLDEVAADRAFLSQFHSVLADYDSYRHVEHQWFNRQYNGDGIHYCIAYFSAEFGLHESLPIYSGGLGILAGDHCKSASDLGLPFTAVGLLYRKGYFTQEIDIHGNQIAIDLPSRFEDLCIEPARDEQGDTLFVPVELPGRTLHLKVWQVRVGHIRMLLLDADIPANSDEDRAITYQLYGGGIENRIRQEICLGVGGVRALRRMGIAPTVWHLNEGHAAFVSLERIRELHAESGLEFDVALEAVAASTIFTTHTPVPAGHDIFPPELFDTYMGHYAEKMGITIERLRALGSGDFGHGDYGFNQTALAIHTSAFQNGVARLHGEVASRMFQQVWPEITPKENPVTSVTNGVHLTTWLAQEWINAFDLQFGGRWRSHFMDREFWDCIHEIPDSMFWGIQNTNKQRMLNYIHELLRRQAERNGESAQLVQEMTRHFDGRALVIGFARRFATYKRATLLFHDEARLAEILSDESRPVLFLFAGKAHPADEPGQALIRRIHQLSRKPEFLGKILMLEGYDMTLARYLLSGVDMWLNNPRRPMEASGTSGMKAAMNGAPNLSVLDGWWPEGYAGDNGWVIGSERDIEDPELHDAEDSRSLYHVLQHEVIPTYYQRNEQGYSEKWVYTCKRAMIESIPRFNTHRMVAEYTERFYIPASRHGREMVEGAFARARALAAWKRKVRASWPQVAIEPADAMPRETVWRHGESITFRIRAHLDGLDPEDVRVDAILLRPSLHKLSGLRHHGTIPCAHVGEGIFAGDITPEDSGDYELRFRIYPTHEDLPHPMAMGMMKYL